MAIKSDRYLCCYLCEQATGRREPYDRAVAKRAWRTYEEKAEHSDT